VSTALILLSVFVEAHIGSRKRVVRTLEVLKGYQLIMTILEIIGRSRQRQTQYLRLAPASTKSNK